MQRLETAEQKIEAAYYLLKGGYYKDAISRAYYSMYHAAQALLESEDIEAKTHTGLIRTIGKEFVKPNRIQKSLGKALSMAEEDRESADYGVDVDFTEEEAKERIEDAEKFLEKSKELLVEK